MPVLALSEVATCNDAICYIITTTPDEKDSRPLTKEEEAVLLPLILQDDTAIMDYCDIYRKEWKEGENKILERGDFDRIAEYGINCRKDKEWIEARDKVKHLPEGALWYCVEMVEKRIEELEPVISQDTYCVKRYNRVFPNAKLTFKEAEASK